MKRNICLIALSALLVAGCATTPHMGYVSKSPAQSLKNISIQVMKFTDQREESQKGKLGGRYNQYGMKAGDVLEPQDLFEDIETGFKTELEKAGYTVTANSQDLVLKGEVIAVSCDQTNGAQNGTVRFRLILTDKGKEVLNSIYTGESKIPFTFDVTCSDAFNDAIRKSIASFVKDLDNYVAS